MPEQYADLGFGHRQEVEQEQIDTQAVHGAEGAALPQSEPKSERDTGKSFGSQFFQHLGSSYNVGRKLLNAGMQLSRGQLPEFPSFGGGNSRENSREGGGASSDGMADLSDKIDELIKAVENLTRAMESGGQGHHQQNQGSQDGQGKQKKKTNAAAAHEEHKGNASVNRGNRTLGGILDIIKMFASI